MLIRRLALVAIAAGALAACGDDGEPAASTPKPKPAKTAEAVSSVVDVATLPSSGGRPFRFDKKVLRAKPGLVEFRLDNRDRWTHNIRIQTGKKCCDPARDIGGTQSTTGPAKSVARVRLERGTYWFICGLIGHFDGDLGKQKGRLVVQ